jgi:hypothetical protein
MRTPILETRMQVPVHHEEAPPGRHRHLRAVPPHDPGRRIPSLGTLLALLVAFLVGALIVFGVQQARIASRDDDVAALSARIERLRGLSDEVAIRDRAIASLESQLQQNAALTTQLAIQSQEAWRRLRVAERARDEALVRVGSLAQLVGPPLPDGPHIGSIRAIATGQEPPVVAFRPAAAGRAEPMRVLRVDPAAVVVLRTAGGALLVTDIDRFAAIMANPEAWADRISHRSFAVTTQGGEVVRIESTG